MRRSLTQAVLVAAMCFSLPALAQDPKKGCPPGAWFCAEADVAVPAPAAPAPHAQPPVVVEEPPQAPPDAPPPVVVHRRPPPPPMPPPPVVVYQPVPTAPPPQVIVVTPGYGYGYAYARPRPPVITSPPSREQRWHPEFGLNLRVEGAIIGKPRGASFNSGLGGVGLSLRYRPVPAFAFDLSADVLAGTDYNGFQRTETPVALNGMLFLNPRGRVQLYLQGGAHFSRAQVRSDFSSALLSPTDGGQWGASYTYFGGQGGGGFEFRLSRRIALDLDALGFIRKRIGDISAPEFVDPGTGRTTNTSAGALVRGGLTFWW